MQRAGNLYPKIAEPENLRLAYWKARRGKRHKREVLAFTANLGCELERLRRQLETETVTWGDYHTFRVYDPKERVICAAAFRERVLHHAILNVCEPVFERYQISASYACRTGRGVHKALEKARGYTRSRGWYLKLDVRKYFDSIDHGVLGDLLARRFKDPQLLRLFAGVIASYQTAPDKGIPIGNLTSQYFANHYLAVLDHFVKEELGVRAYLRYMDDLLLWSDDPAELKSWQRAIAGFVRDRLQLELKPPALNRCARGVSALGYRITPHTVRLTRRSRDRFARKLNACERALADGEITEQQAAQRVEPLLAFTKHAEARNVRRALLGVAPEARTA